MREKNIPNTIDPPTSNNRSFHHYPPIYIPLSSRAFSRIRSSRGSARPTSLTFISPIWHIRLHMHRPCMQMRSMSIPRRGPRRRTHTNRYRHRYRHTLLVLLMRILLIRHLLLLRCRWSRTHTRRSSSHRRRYRSGTGYNSLSVLAASAFMWRWRAGTACALETAAAATLDVR